MISSSSKNSRDTLPACSNDRLTSAQMALSRSPTTNSTPPRYGSSPTMPDSSIVSRSSGVCVTGAKVSSRQCPINQLPYDLLLAIFSLLAELCGSMSPMATLSLVCKHWNQVSNEPFLWEHLAKTFFVAFPLVHQLTGVSQSMRGRRNLSNNSFGTPTTTGPNNLSRSGNSPLDAYLGAGTVVTPPPVNSMAAAYNQHHQQYTNSSHRRTDSTTSSHGSRSRTPVSNLAAGAAASPRTKEKQEEDPPPGFFGNMLVKAGLRRRIKETTPQPAPKKQPKHGAFTSMPANLRPKGPRTNKRAFLARLNDVESIDSQRRYQHLVNRRRGPVLHAFVNGALFCLCMCILVGMLALEGVEPKEAINAEVAFGFFWCTYLFIFAIVVTNVVMAAHFEPHPLVPRVKRHFRLIVLSAATLIGTLFTVALPMVILQRNIFQLIDSVAQGTHPENSPVRADWLKAAGPVILAMLAWQGEVLYSTRHSLEEWLRSEITWTALILGRMNWSSLYHIGAHSTPLFFVVSLLSAVEATVNPTSTFHRLVGTFPLFMTTSILSLVFAMEFSGRRRLIDGVAALSLLVASVFPVVIVLLPLRGFTLIPLFLAITGFYFGHLNEMRRRMVLFEEGDEGELGAEVLDE